ncbi:hypothetical protein MARPU_14105 [Marichromatium purpuratum 984]|uniref:Uncharacterized protein n=1 Tax=Marichromatium purpuratum 984 TaxID=765910 RepID=W0E7W7_MARPU|nr:hypothetical protein [Marichromatium purpuratum]AHF05613.1 hypothetical protein MARPU_14105 [Marichromatium purpuratum 984]
MNKITTRVFTGLIGAALVVAIVPHLDQSRQAFIQRGSAQQLARMEHEIAAHLRLLEQLEERLATTGLTPPPAMTTDTLLARSEPQAAPPAPRRDDSGTVTAASASARSRLLASDTSARAASRAMTPPRPEDIEPWWLDYEVGMIYAARHNSRALVNGHLLAPGEAVDARVQLVAIESTAVWLDRDGQRRRVELRLAEEMLTRPVIAPDAEVR